MHDHHRHSATALTIIAGAAGAAALCAVVVGSCLGPDVATVDGGEPPFVETVAGVPTAPAAVVTPSSASDSTGGTGNVSLTSAELQMSVDPRADAAVKARK